MKITAWKILSLVISAGYILASMFFVHERAYVAIKLSLELLLPLAFIWFPEQFGNYVGYFGDGNYIDQRTPAIIVSAMGWFFLIGFPLLLYLLIKYVA